eukprot:SAG25_NODE_1108_length_3951_cov_1.777259_6_plen_169_part_00
MFGGDLARGGCWSPSTPSKLAAAAAWYRCVQANVPPHRREYHLAAQGLLSLAHKMGEGGSDAPQLAPATTQRGGLAQRCIVTGAPDAIPSDALDTEDERARMAEDGAADSRAPSASAPVVWQGHQHGTCVAATIAAVVAWLLLSVWRGRRWWGTGGLRQRFLMLLRAK